MLLLPFISNIIIFLLHGVFFFSENHNLVFVNAGFTDPRVYRYWDPVNRSIDFQGMMEDLRGAPPNSVVIFHACAHNPTGCDPTKEQWKALEALVRVCR